MISGALLILILTVPLMAGLWWSRRRRRRRDWLEALAIREAMEEEAVLPAMISVIPVPGIDVKWTDKVSALLLILFVLGLATSRLLPIVDDPVRFYSLWVVLAVWAVFSAVLLIDNLLRTGRNAHRFESHSTADADERPLLVALSRARIPWRLFWRHPGGAAWTRLRDSLAREDLQPPRTVIDLRVVEAVRDVPLTEDFREPELILPSSAIPLRDARLGLIVLPLLAGLLLLIGGWGLASVLGGLWVIMVLSRPGIRNAVPGLRFESRGILAGPGFLRDRRNRIFSAEEGMLLIRRAGRHRWRNAPILAVVLGPAGCLRMRFVSLRDPDFRNLWQLWNHPHPRPELAADPASNLAPMA